MTLSTASRIPGRRQNEGSKTRRGGLGAKTLGVDSFTRAIRARIRQLKNPISRGYLGRKLTYAPHLKINTGPGGREA